MIKNRKFGLALMVVMILAIIIEVIRDTFTTLGDFKGYVLVGNLTLQSENIYNQPLINTWPPFFSVVSIPVALLDNFNPYLSRFLWLSLSVFAMYLVVRIVTKMALQRKLIIYPLLPSGLLPPDKIHFLHFAIIIPVLLSFRYILDNLANIQINIFMLLIVLMSLHFFIKRKEVLGGLILAFGISIKVYPVFLLLYFVVKREFSIVLFTLIFTILFALVPFLIYGYEQTLEYYSFWYHQNVEPFASVAHKNQSFFSMMRSLLTHESPGLNQPLNQEIYLNIIDLSIEQVKVVSYALIAIAGSFVIYLFRDKLSSRSSMKSFLEYSFILTITPILSPLAWKAFFIFLFPAFFINYLFLYQLENKLSKSMKRLLFFNYYLAIVLVIFSSDLFVGKYISDLFELYSSITIGTILLAINMLLFYTHLELYSIKIRTY